MTQAAVAVQFTADPLEPLFGDERAFLRMAVNLAPGKQFAKGTILGQLIGSANDVQTFTATGTPTGGSFTYLVTNPLTNVQANLVIPFNATSTNLQALANALFGTGNTTAGGGPWPGTPLTLTAAGNLLAFPVPLAVAGTNAFTGGSSPASTVAHTTVGQTEGTYDVYNGTVLMAPAVAATATVNTGTATPPAAGNYMITYTYLTALGETTAAPPVLKVANGTNDIIVASIAFPAGATAINYYINGYFDGQRTTAGTFVVNLANQTGQEAPRVTNTAFTTPNGSGTQVAACILQHNCTSDAGGRIVRGLVTTGGTTVGLTGVIGESYPDTPAYFRGDFDSRLLTGLDANAIAQLGRVYAATTLQPPVPRVLRLT